MAQYFMSLGLKIQTGNHVPMFLSQRSNTYRSPDITNGHARDGELATTFWQGGQSRVLYTLIHRYLYPFIIAPHDTEVVLKFRHLNPGNSARQQLGRVGISMLGRSQNNNSPGLEKWNLITGNPSSTQNFRKIYFKRQRADTTFNSPDASSANVLNVTTLQELYASALLLRFRVQGSTFLGKYWKDGTTEPDWQLTHSSSDSPFASTIFLLPGHQYSVTDFISVGVGTNGDSAPLTDPEGIKVLRGTVNLPNGNPASGQLVRAYHRKTHCFMGQDTTNAQGMFRIPVKGVPMLHYFYCIAYDSNNRANALLFDHMTQEVE